MNRVGIWRLFKKLESQNYIKLKSLDNKKTSTYIVELNWDNPLLSRLLSLYLADEAMKERKWFQKLQGLERIVEFLITYIPDDETKKITIISVVPNKKIKIHHTSNELEEKREINTINLTEPDFIEYFERIIKSNPLNKNSNITSNYIGFPAQDFTKKNPDFIEQIIYGKVLFGQEKFIQVMKQIHARNQ